MFEFEFESEEYFQQDIPPRITQTSQDTFFASVVKFLINGQEFDAAQMLLASGFFVVVESYHLLMEHGFLDYVDVTYIIEVSCPRNVLDKIKYYGPNTEIHNAITWVLGHSNYSLNVTYLRQPIDMGPDWRSRLIDLAEHEGVEANNQGRGAETSDYFTPWNGLKFRSMTETRIAEVLENRAVMYFPLCTARLGLRNDRKMREPDFLVCHKGKWGILEVDGPHHTGRAADDHERDRLFKNHGIKVVEHYNSDDCFTNPDKVVGQFLYLLEKSG